MFILWSTGIIESSLLPAVWAKTFGLGRQHCNLQTNRRKRHTAVSVVGVWRGKATPHTHPDGEFEEKKPLKLPPERLQKNHHTRDFL
jgi:hypothetical protein